MIYAMLRLVTRSLRRADASMFNVAMLTEQAEAEALFSMVLHDWEKQFGLDPLDHMCTSWDCCQELSSYEMLLERRMQCSMTCEVDCQCFLHSRNGSDLRVWLQ